MSRRGVAVLLAAAIVGVGGGCGGSTGSSGQGHHLGPVGAGDNCGHDHRRARRSRGVRPHHRPHHRGRYHTGEDDHARHPFRPGRYRLCAAPSASPGRYHPGQLCHRPGLRSRRAAVLRRTRRHGAGVPGWAGPGVRDRQHRDQRGGRRIQRTRPAGAGHQSQLHRRSLRVRVLLRRRPGALRRHPLGRLRRGRQVGGHHHPTPVGRRLLPQGRAAGLRPGWEAVRDVG